MLKILQADGGQIPLDFDKYFIQEETNGEDQIGFTLPLDHADYKLLTEAARAALPKEVTHKDAVYNLSRAALVPAAFCEGRHDLLAIATEDKLHQPYRMPLMPGSKEVFDMARLCGAKAVYVSGAGSTVMAVAEKAEAEKFYSKLEKGLELLEGLDGCEAFTLLRLDADNTGATVE